MLKTVLFDLDGTLLPMDQETFVKYYLKLLSQKMADRYDPKKLVAAVWKGTEAMYRNPGEKTNEALFWEVFSQAFGPEVLEDIPLFDEFYRVEFQAARNSCGFDPRAKEAIRAIHNMGLSTALATNPLFPPLATCSRVRWAGLEPEDFTLITTYDNSRHCKPNPAYYQDILDALNLQPQECVMVGNDASEDLAAAKLGIPVFLLTDCLINKENKDLTVISKGSYPELIQYLHTLIEGGD